MNLIKNFKYLKNVKMQKYIAPQTNYALYLPKESFTTISTAEKNPTAAEVAVAAALETACKNEDRERMNTIENTYGQPTHKTHPHLVNEGELVSGVTLEEFQSRRHRLMNAIQTFSMKQFDGNAVNKKCHMVFVPSSEKKYMSDKIPYVFRQNSDFYYLTGCLEPESGLLMTIDQNGKVNCTLFMRPKDKHLELWDGPRTGFELAPDMFGVDDAYSIEEFSNIFSKQIHKLKPIVWYDFEASGMKSMSDVISYSFGKNTESPTTFIHGMRLFKSPAEQTLMRKTCSIASQAINEVMLESKPGLTEHHLFAMVDYKCRMKNASYLAYPPVVAAGNNGTTIHYIDNSQMTQKDDLVLMDAGCEYGGYTSDITRTWPISGTFNPYQKLIYDVVLQVQVELINEIFQGDQTLDNLFDIMCYKIGKYLQEVGLVPKSITQPMDYARAGYKFCPHHVSHYLGMDVHDTPSISRSINIKPGMVFTVEPGVYIGAHCKDVPQEFRGIAVRIEDDILVTGDKRIEVLTRECTKYRRDIENLFKPAT